MLKRKDSILISAIDLLSKKGINGLTTRNLAKKEKVSEAALYRQYSSKLDIIIHIINEFSIYDDKIMNTIREAKITGKEGVIYYVKLISQFYQNYSELTTVMFSMDVYFYDSKTKKLMEDIIEKKLNFLNEIIIEGQLSGDISNLFDSKELAKIIDGLIFSYTYDYKVNKCKSNLEENLIDVVSKLL